jgi:hypothetical protein
MDDDLNRVLDANAAGHTELQRQIQIWGESVDRKLDLLLELLLSESQKLDQLDAKVDKIADLDTRVTRLEVASSRRRRI